MKLRHYLALTLVSITLVGCNSNTTIKTDSTKSTDNTLISNYKKHQHEPICNIDGVEYSLEDMSTVTDDLRADISNAFYEQKVIEKLAQEKGIDVTENKEDLLTKLIESYNIEPSEENILKYMKENEDTLYSYRIGIKTFNAIEDAEAYNIKDIMYEDISDTYEIVVDTNLVPFSEYFKNGKEVGSVSELEGTFEELKYYVILDKILPDDAQDFIATQVLNKLTTETVFNDIDRIKESMSFENYFEISDSSSEDANINITKSK